MPIVGIVSYCVMGLCSTWNIGISGGVLRLVVGLLGSEFLMFHVEHGLLPLRRRSERAFDDEGLWVVHAHGRTGGAVVMECGLLRREFPVRTFAL